jgi:hypothetical protein
MTTRREFVSRAAVGALALGAATRALAADAASGAAPSAALLERARSLLDKAPLIDTHNDLPSMILEANGGDVS